MDGGIHHFIPGALGKGHQIPLLSFTRLVVGDMTPTKGGNLRPRTHRPLESGWLESDLLRLFPVVRIGFWREHLLQRRQTQLYLAETRGPEPQKNPHRAECSDEQTDHTYHSD